MKHALATATAALVLLPLTSAGAQQRAPVRVAVVVEAAPEPLLGPDGQPLDETGDRLDASRRALERLFGSPVPITVSVSPVFVDELRLLGARASRTHAALLRLVSAHPLMTRPRTDVQLPHLTSREEMKAELRAGADATVRQTNERPLPLLHPPALDVSTAVLQTARDAKLSAVLVGSREITGSVRAEGIQLVPTLASSGGPATPELIDGIEEGNDDAIAVVLDVEGATQAVAALSSDERFTVVPITDLLGDVPERPVAFPAGARPPEYYWQAVARAEGALAAFSSYTPGNNSTRETLDLLLDLARSSAHWRDQWERASELAGAIADRVTEERALVSSSSGSVTLTSERGTVPVTVINNAHYPVRVLVRVRSPRLNFPEGASQVASVSPRGATLTFAVEAESSGTFPMTVSVNSPDGSIEFNQSEVLVRSTAARVPALVLTAGAALFLLAWSSRGFIRRKRGPTR